MKWVSDLYGPVYHVIYINADTTNVNLFSLAGSPARGNFEFQIATGVVVGGTNVLTPAIRTGAMPGLTRIINKGTIIGHGGNGADGQGLASAKIPGNGGGGGGGAGFGPTFTSGGNACANAQSGQAGSLLTGGAGGNGGQWNGAAAPVDGTTAQSGGPAIFLDVDISLDNSAGAIYGGGGGGGGGLATSDPTNNLNSGGNGGAAGSFGIGGKNGSGVIATSGGSPGDSITLNGHTCTFIGSHGSILPAL